MPFSIWISYPSIFFGVGRGLCQGCSLSPLLFILVMGYLRNKIRATTKKGLFKGVCICLGISVSHNIFVDDILVFGVLSRVLWRSFHNILAWFKSATILMANDCKSYILYYVGYMRDIIDIANMFNYKCNPLLEGITYLGCKLKLVNYRIEDWY